MKPPTKSRKKKAPVEWVVPFDPTRCPKLWKPQGNKWKEERVCLKCGAPIIYKNDGGSIMTDTARRYGIEPGWYHLSFLMECSDKKMEEYNADREKDNKVHSPGDAQEENEGEVRTGQGLHTP